MSHLWIIVARPLTLFSLSPEKSSDQTLTNSMKGKLTELSALAIDDFTFNLFRISIIDYTYSSYSNMAEHSETLEISDKSLKFGNGRLCTRNHSIRFSGQKLAQRRVRQPTALSQSTVTQNKRVAHEIYTFYARVIPKSRLIASIHCALFQCDRSTPNYFHLDVSRPIIFPSNSALNDCYERNQNRKLSAARPCFHRQSMNVKHFIQFFFKRSIMACSIRKAYAFSEAPALPLAASKSRCAHFGLLRTNRKSASAPSSPFERYTFKKAAESAGCVVPHCQKECRPSDSSAGELSTTKEINFTVGCRGEQFH
jgi:hypothetical protein